MSGRCAFALLLAAHAAAVTVKSIPPAADFFRYSGVEPSTPFFGGDSGPAPPSFFGDMDFGPPPTPPSDPSLFGGAMEPPPVAPSEPAPSAPSLFGGGLHASMEPPPMPPSALSVGGGASSGDLAAPRPTPPRPTPPQPMPPQPMPRQKMPRQKMPPQPMPPQPMPRQNMPLQGVTPQAMPLQPMPPQPMPPQGVGPHPQSQPRKKHVATLQDAGWQTTAEQNAVGACSDAESYVSMRVERLTSRMRGKLSSNASFTPDDRPMACMSWVNRVNCYHAWGFTLPVAQCWADEEKMAIMSECDGTCKRRIRNRRRKCIFEAMQLTAPCVQCKMEAYQFWEHECREECKDPFAFGEITATEECLKCNDKLYLKLLPRC